VARAEKRPAALEVDGEEAKLGDDEEHCRKE
jgi:hypothetical protein